MTRLSMIVLACGSLLAACQSNAPDVADASVFDAASADANPPDAASPKAPLIDTGAIAPPAQSEAQTEPAVAVSADGTLVVTWLDSELTTWGLGYAFSHDHGVTWGPSQLLTMPAGLYAGNETVQADADGNFHVVTLGVNADASAIDVLIAGAPAGVDMFGDTTLVSDPTLAVPRDAPAFVIASDGSLNIDWTEYSADLTSSLIVAARSIDGGVTWSRTSLTAPHGEVAWPNLCASKIGGQVTAVFEDAVGVGFRWSSDDGETWPDANTNVVPLSENPGEFPSCMQKGLDLWIMQGVTMQAASTSYEPALDEIELVHSGDGGLTLDPVVPVQDKKAGGAYMRAMGALQADGSISLVYYAGSIMNDPAATVRYSVSRDGGKTFSPSSVVWSPLTLTTSRLGLNWLGDLLGVAADADTAFAGYVDNGSGASHVRVSRILP
jgi:hypothetical protein